MINYTENYWTEKGSMFILESDINYGACAWETAIKCEGILVEKNLIKIFSTSKF